MAKTIWGIHNDTLSDELIDQGFISIGWDNVGDLHNISGGREGRGPTMVTGSLDPDAGYTAMTDKLVPESLLNCRVRGFENHQPQWFE